MSLGDDAWEAVDVSYIGSGDLPLTAASAHELRHMGPATRMALAAVAAARGADAATVRAVQGLKEAAEEAKVAEPGAFAMRTATRVHLRRLRATQTARRKLAARSPPWCSWEATRRFQKPPQLS